MRLSLQSFESHAIHGRDFSEDTARQIAVTAVDINIGVLS